MTEDEMRAIVRDELAKVRREENLQAVKRETDAPIPPLLGERPQR